MNFLDNYANTCYQLKNNLFIFVKLFTHRNGSATIRPQSKIQQIGGVGR
nr:MAG TPA: hypothetical protein [Caudoviricetes sp.]